MPLAEERPVITADALGGFFAVSALEPRASFYNALRERGAESLRIRWTWLAMVQFAVDFAVQGMSGRLPEALDVEEGMIAAIKAAGVDADQDLSEIETRLSAYGQLVSRRASSLEIGQALAGHSGADITNPAVLFQLGQELLNLIIDVNAKLSLFEIRVITE